jgi:hypothetical protein
MKAYGLKAEKPEVNGDADHGCHQWGDREAPSQFAHVAGLHEAFDFSVGHSDTHALLRQLQHRALALFRGTLAECPTEQMDPAALSLGRVNPSPDRQNVDV